MGSPSASTWSTRPSSTRPMPTLSRMAPQRYPRATPIPPPTLLTMALDPVTTRMVRQQEVPSTSLDHSSGQLSCNRARHHLTHYLPRMSPVKTSSIISTKPSVAAVSARMPRVRALSVLGMPRRRHCSMPLGRSWMQTPSREYIPTYPSCKRVLTTCVRDTGSLSVCLAIMTSSSASFADQPLIQAHLLMTPSYREVRPLTCKQEDTRTCHSSLAMYSMSGLCSLFPHTSTLKSTPPHRGTIFVPQDSAGANLISQYLDSLLEPIGLQPNSTVTSTIQAYYTSSSGSPFGAPANETFGLAPGSVLSNQYARTNRR